MNKRKKEREKEKQRKKERKRNSSGREALKETSTSLTIREMQIKTTLRIHLAPVRMPKINKSSSCR